MKFNRLYLYLIVIIGGASVGILGGTLIINAFARFFNLNLEGQWGFLIVLIILIIIPILSSLLALKEELNKAPKR